MYLASVGLTKKDVPVKPAGAPYSVSYMLANGSAARAVDRFAAAGVTLDDIPALRRAAQAWLAKVPA